MPRRARSPSSAQRPAPSSSASAPAQPELLVIETGKSTRSWHLAGERLVPQQRAPQSASHRPSLPARWAAEVRSIFLPVGYPDSVRPEYLRFQFFDTLQAACSYLRSILTTSAIAG